MNWVLLFVDNFAFVTVNLRSCFQSYKLFQRQYSVLMVLFRGGFCFVCRMASVSSQPQFRYTQPPSKVLHLRNLPWECTEEELIELGKPFGKVVNTKCNVGANRNQAFIEFVSLVLLLVCSFQQIYYWVIYYFITCILNL